MKKPSFLERLTGSVATDEFDEILDGTTDAEEPAVDDGGYEEEPEWPQHEDAAEPQEGELPVDMYQTGDSIVIRALVAGVSPGDLDISITRDMVTVRGQREEIQEAVDDDYYHRELFWGGFSRTLLLPEEVIIDEAEAKEKHGLLEIVLPKVDKDRSTQLKVKSHAQK
jgi:HSP20 family protein